MRCPAAYLVLLAATVLAVPGAAQSPATPGAAGRPAPARPAAQKPEAAKPDPALAAAAQKLAGAYRLTSADGTRSCPLTLKSAATSATGFGVERDPAACAAIPFSSDASAWAPDVSGSIRLRAADGRLVAEFSEATGGTYEALREGDGVYFLVSPSAVQVSDVSMEEMLGEWSLVRAVGTPALCRWTLTEQAVAATASRPPGFAVSGDKTCAGIGDFSPGMWRIEGGNIVITAVAGTQLLRFARQEDGSWAKTPERGRPLLLIRP